MQRGGLCLAVAGAILWFAMTGAAQPASGPEEWTSVVTVLQVHGDDEPDTAPLEFGGISSGSWANWILSTDMPVDLRTRPFRSDVYIAMDIDTAGHGTACRLLRGGIDARLDRLSCELLMQRAVFEPRYETPTRPVAHHVVMGIRWESIDAATRADRERQRRAMAPPVQVPWNLPELRQWPRPFWSEDLLVRNLPAIQASYPRDPGQPEEGIVSLDIIVTAGVGISACQIGVSSGNAALDEAACRVARTLDITYERPCEGCWGKRLPLEVVWRRHGSHIRLPLPRQGAADSAIPPRDPADQRPPSRVRSYFPTPVAFNVDERDFRNVPIRTTSNAVPNFRVSVSAQGRVTGCEPGQGSGNDAVDRRICELLIERGRYLPLTDIFGDPIPSRTFFRLRLPR